MTSAVAVVTPIVFNSSWLTSDDLRWGLVIGDVDGLVALDEVDVLLQLLHLQLQALLPVLLGGGVRDDRQALVLMMQLLPVLLQALK